MSDREFFKDMVDEYIENQIQYTKNELELCGTSKSMLYTLSYLESMTDEQKETIVEKVLNDDELYNKIDETIHYYLFH